MRYAVNFDKVINQLVPHYLGGRKYILYLQALCKPLQTANDSFSEWANETLIEANMTSQIIKFEWYLNRKFRKYFADKANSIAIKNGKRNGVAAYWEAADIIESDNMLLKYESEAPGGSEALHYHDETTDENDCSFIVYSPQIDTRLISEIEYTAMVSYIVDRYKVAGKTYKIIFNQ
jgi:hypothetical protein